MWTACFLISVGCLVLAGVFLLAASVMGRHRKKLGARPFHLLFAGVFAAALFLFLPIDGSAAGMSFWGCWRAFLLSLFHSMQVFTIGCDYNVIAENIARCPAQLAAAYQLWAAVLYALAPIFTFGFLLSFFKNLSAYFRYLCAYFQEAYIFSELNEKSLVLAGDIKSKDKNAVIVFTDVFEGNEEKSYELMGNAEKIGAICFKKDILLVDFKRHSPKAQISFFAIGSNETENLNQSLKLIEAYRQRENTRILAFSTQLESELLLTMVDKGKLKVRRINEVQSLVNRVLYEEGELLFQSARAQADGTKKISAVVVGMGRHGTEMVKALSWFGQMDGYSLEIDAFDRDPLAEEKFTALAPELMSPAYNGVCVEGEAQYRIAIHSGIDVESATFARKILALGDATYVVVALGNDALNIKAAVDLRMYFERRGIHPVIQTIVYNSEQKKALQGVRNYRGQAYDIRFIGDVESSYTEAVILDSELENRALERHKKWGEEEGFWTYEYNYRSSMASAIHKEARAKCGIPGADKEEKELTEEERRIIESLEHRRWNAYMRAEGYVFSGSKDKSSRNDLAKMHHDLVDFASLSEEEKRKDSRVGTN